jgi:predicted hydrocarbon binding protein
MHLNELPVSDKYTDNPQPSISLFGYELIREVLLPELLGKDAPEILYWAGKKMARKYPLASINEILEFFIDANWGVLSVKEEKRRELVMELSGEIVSNRLKRDKGATFQLEAGFLAQQLEIQKAVAVETFEHPHKRLDKILFTIKWDVKDPILSSNT